MRSSKAQMTSRRGRSRVRRSRSDGSMIDRRQAVKGGSRSRSAAALPAPHGAVFQAGDGEIRGLVGVLRCEGLVDIDAVRSEEHTSELQSLMRNSYAVFCLKK